MAQILRAVDNGVFEAFQRLHGPFLDAVMPYITKLGDIGLLWILTAAVLLLTKKYRRCGVMMAVGLALSLLVGNAVLKPIIARIRPYEAFPQIQLLIEEPSGFSFPSAHAMTSFAAAAALFCGWRRAGIPALLIAFLIAASRIYLYVHYPTDVLAGALVGFFLGILAKYLTEWGERLFSRTKERDER